MWIVRLALRNARRNVRRSLLTAATVVIGVALFVVTMSVLGGVMDQMYEDTTAFTGHVRVADADFIDREALAPLYEYLPDADAVVDAARDTPGVTGAYAVVESGVAVSAGEELGDVFGLAVGADPEWYREIGLHEQIVEGRAPSAPGEWMLGSKLAEKADANIGDEIVLFGQTQDGSLSPARGTLTGIVHGGTALSDRRVYLSLAEMQDMVDLGDGAIQVLVYVDDLMGAHEVAARLGEHPALDGARAQAWSQREPFAAVIPMMGVMQALLAGSLVFLTALAIWNTMTMSVLERTGEIGVMRAMGLSRLGAVGMFVVEAAAIAVIGGLLGVALGAGPALWFETNGITYGEDLVDQMGGAYALKSTMYGDFTPAIAVKGLVLGIVMAVAGSLVPSMRAAAIHPVEAMRHGR